MAKDGTKRGGARIGAGRKKKSLESKILEGKVTDVETKDNEKFKPPKPKEYISAKQKMGVETHAAEIYAGTYEWLKERGCAEIVTPQLVENYAQMIGRHIQCEELLNQTGLLAKHPTTGDPIASPFVRMSLDYLKSAQQLWYQIWQIARENSIQGVGDSANDEMEKILRIVK